MYYIAYGSNMNLAQMKVRCPKSVVVGVGWLRGYKLRFNIHADIIYTGHKKDIVPVVLWEINTDDWESLDRYEGFPKYYIKETVMVEFGHKNIECIVYVMSPSNAIGNELPEEYYYNIIYNGYKTHHIPVHYLHDAINYTVERIEKNILMV